jgi:hypothetical protein
MSGRGAGLEQQREEDENNNLLDNKQLKEKGPGL